VLKLSNKIIPKINKKVMKTNENKLKSEIDDFINNLIATLISKLKASLESITIVGSFGVKRISLERPNVNIFIFLKKGVEADIILKIGYIIYKTAISYLRFFSVKVDSFPYRLGIPEGGKRLEGSTDEQVKQLMELLMEKKDLLTIQSSK
jgi:hypothetical protein